MDNHLEIFSPGGFPGLVDINNLGDGTTFLRNPTLVRIAYQMNLVETRRTGIRLIYDSCRKAKIKSPQYSEDGDFVKLTFEFQLDVESYALEEQAILAYIRISNSVSAQQIADYLQVSRNTAIRKLNKLIKVKKIVKVCQGAAVRYRVIKLRQQQKSRQASFNFGY